jgi:hypothetical protein
VADNRTVDSVIAGRSAMYRAMAHVALRSSGGPVDPGLRVTLNFHPDRLASGVPMLEALAAPPTTRPRRLSGPNTGR